MDKKQFMHQLWRYKNGSVTRRHFLGVTGLGLATAVMARAMPELVGARPAFAGNIGDKVSLATWPAYHDPKNFEKFKALTGAEVQVSVFGANEEFLAKLQAGGASRSFGIEVAKIAGLPASGVGSKAPTLLVLARRGSAQMAAASPGRRGPIS